MEKRALEPEDRELVEIARGAIAPCYDGEEYRHTVGCALRAADGKIYRGVNVYSIHGTCAEPVAIGAAVMDGAREFDCIVAVRGGERGEIMPPCGNCRQILGDYMPDCWVIVEDEGGLCKVRAKELLPFPYRAEY